MCAEPSARAGIPGFVRSATGQIFAQARHLLAFILTFTKGKIWHACWHTWQDVYGCRGSVMDLPTSGVCEERGLDLPTSGVCEERGLDLHVNTWQQHSANFKKLANCVADSMSTPVASEHVAGTRAQFIVLIETGLTRRRFCAPEPARSCRARTTGVQRTCGVLLTCVPHNLPDLNSPRTLHLRNPRHVRQHAHNVRATHAELTTEECMCAWSGEGDSVMFEQGAFFSHRARLNRTLDSRQPSKNSDQASYTCRNGP